MKKIIYCFLIFLPLLMEAQTDFEASFSKLTTDISTKLNKKNFKSVGVWDFVDLAGNTSTLTKYITDKMSVNLVNDAVSYGILNRNHLNTIMKEHRLASEGFISEETVKQLGKFTSLDVVVTGTVTVLTQKIEITITVLNTETALTVVAGSATLPITNDIKMLMGQPVDLSYTKPNSNTNNSNKGYNGIPIQSGESYNDPSTVNNECINNNTGDYCFTNNTNVEIDVRLFNSETAPTTSINSSPYKKMLLQPGETKCFYDIPAKATTYGVYGQVYTNNSWVLMSGGQIKIEKCKSKTISVNGTYKHYESKY